MTKAKTQNKTQTALALIEPPKTIIRTRAQKKRAMLEYHRDMFAQIADYYMKHGSEPVDPQLRLYIQQVRVYQEEGRFHPEFTKLATEMAPWLVRQEPKVDAAAATTATAAEARAALALDLVTLALVILFFFLTKDMIHQHVEGFLAARWYSVRV